MNQVLRFESAMTSTALVFPSVLFMPELPWVKWFPQLWLSESGLGLCSPATRGIWADALNHMLLSRVAKIVGTSRQLAKLCRCRPQELEAAAVELFEHKVAQVEWQNDSITIANRRLHRDKKIRELRRKSGRKGAAKRWQTLSSMSMARSTSTSTCTNSPGIGVQGEGSGPTWEMAQGWRADWLKNGADYTEFETRGAYLALQASGWMWGRNPVIDYRAALERQIQTDRKREDYVRTNKPSDANDANPKPVRGSNPVSGF